MFAIEVFMRTVIVEQDQLIEKPAHVKGLFDVVRWLGGRTGGTLVEHNPC